MHKAAICSAEGPRFESSLNPARPSGSSPEEALLCHENHTENIKMIIL